MTAAPAFPPAVRVEALRHRFGSFEALSGVSFEVGRGEVFGFIGPNGAGKTTTIRAIATLQVLDAGRIEVCGVDVRRDPERVRRLLGYMPDHAGVYERLTTLEYLEFFADVQRVPRRRVSEVVELTKLGAVADRYVAELSKGLKQRVQLARILLHDPEVLILDEPASDLDPRARVELRELISELRRSGKTILLSSHILSDLSDVCTHVGILDRGRVVAYGPIGQISATLPGSGDAGGAPAASDETPAATAIATATRDPDGGVYRVASAPGSCGANLRVIGERDHILAALAAVPHVSDVTVYALGRVSLSYVGDERVLGAAVKALVDAGIVVYGVEPRQNELERVFLQITSGSTT